MLHMELMPCQKPMLECTRSDGEGRSWVELNVPPARHTGLSQEREREQFILLQSPNLPYRPGLYASPFLVTPEPSF